MSRVKTIPSLSQLFLHHSLNKKKSISEGGVSPQGTLVQPSYEKRENQRSLPLNLHGFFKYYGSGWWFLSMNGLRKTGYIFLLMLNFLLKQKTYF